MHKVVHKTLFRINKLQGFQFWHQFYAMTITMHNNQTPSFEKAKNINSWIIVVCDE